MRKSVVALVLLMLAGQNPPRVEAGAFATEVTQLLNHAQLVMEYIRQGEQLANELNMYADMVKNSRVLSGRTFGALINDINALAGIVQGGRALAYSLGISISCSGRHILATDTTLARITSNTATGRKHPWIPRWALFASRDSKASSSRVSRPF